MKIVLAQRFVNSKQNFSLDKYHSKYRLGFTLTELLIVISILGILMSTAVIGLRGARNKARIGKAKSEMRLYGMAVKEFNNRNLFGATKWPISAEGPDLQLAYTDKSGNSQMIDCRNTGGLYTVSPQLIEENLWKEGDCIAFKYYYDAASGEVGIQWPGVDKQWVAISDTDALGLSDDVLLIINSSATAADKVIPGGRNSKLSGMTKNVIYMDKNF